VAKEALQSLIRAYQTIADGAIWLVVFCLPIALPIGIVAFFVIRGIRKMNKKRKGQIVEVKQAEKQ
jgi:cytochrome c biogenesis protein CcdA